VAESRTTSSKSDAEQKFDDDKEYTATDPRTGKVTKVYGTIAAKLVDSGYDVK
jgi:hypothetical protein